MFRCNEDEKKGEINGIFDETERCAWANMK